MTGDFEDANFCGEFATFPMYNGYNIEGTITDKKQDSSLELAILEGYRTGVMPDIVLIVSVGPAGSSKRERWSVYGVVVHRGGACQHRGEESGGAGAPL